MIDPRGRGVVVFRWGVFLLAAGYVVDALVISADYSGAGGPFRYLTIWALLLSFFVASRNLAFSERRSERLWHRTVMLTSVVNVLVVGLYWQLYLTDPTLVNATGQPPVWLREYYLHLLGPLLQWIDALFILGTFRRWWQALPGLLAFIAFYVGWTELVVGPLNNAPAGSVTDGLPYPFLNDLEPAARAAFYATTTAQAVAVLLALAALAWVIRRVTSPGSDRQAAR